MLNLTAYFTAAILTFGFQLSGFFVAYLLQTEVFYDIFGGLNFLLVGLLGHLTRNGPASTRNIGMTCLFVASRGWLLLFLAWRAHQRKGDSRFDGVKDKFGLFLVFWMAQAFWVYLISCPLLTVQALDFDPNVAQGGLTLYDKVMLLGFCLGVTSEIVSDVQKSQWVSEGRNGGFCSVGLWKFSRHPNYFGEIFQWWCAWLLSLGSLKALQNPSWTAVLCWLTGIASPLFTMHILLNLPATGVWNAEGKGLKRYYESENGDAYKEYRASTSPLIPMIGYKDLPLSIKRQFLFEWERFEYRPDKKE
jgi:steroid 5-alpha reductase family enzyme